MKINWKVRFNNITFYAQLGLSILTPVLAYMGLTLADLTTWGAFGEILLEAISNPYGGEVSRFGVLQRNLRFASVVRVHKRSS